MAKNFQQIIDRMSPRRQARVQERTRDMLAGLLLTNLRCLQGLTQAQLAMAAGIKQPSLSKLEAQQDMKISTLLRIVEALGGNLEIVAHLPKGDVRAQSPVRRSRARTKS